MGIYTLITKGYALLVSHCFPASTQFLITIGKNTINNIRLNLINNQLII